MLVEGATNGPKFIYCIADFLTTRQRLDAHLKKQQAAHPGLTLMGVFDFFDVAVIRAVARG